MECICACCCYCLVSPQMCFSKHTQDGEANITKPISDYSKVLQYREIIGKSIYLYSRHILPLFDGKDMEYSSVAKSVTWSQSNRACFLVPEDRKPTNKQQLAAVKTWRSISRDPWAPDYRQALTAKDFHPSIKTVLIFTVMSLCPNTIEPLEIEVLCLKWL